MSSYGITPQGFVIKRLDTIMEEISAGLKAGWGIDTTINPQSFISVLNTSFADQIAALWELGQETYNGMYPSSADGVSLDNAMQYGGVTRLQKARTIYTLNCTGKDGTDIIYGSFVRSTTQPEKQFQCSMLQKIGRESFRSIRLKAVVSAELTVYTIALNNGTYTYQQKAGDTEDTVLVGLAAAIKDDNFKTSIITKQLVIEAVNRQSSNTLVISANLLVTECSSNIVFESMEYGKVMVPNGTITEIVTITPGWDSVTNDISPVAGRLTETDIAARQSYIQRIAVRSRSMLDSIKAGIYNNVQGVSAVEAYENDTNAADADGRVPHSVEVIVDGGDDGEIAQEIFVEKTNGIATNGKISIDVADESGNIHTIKFNRPEYLFVWLKIDLTRNPKEAVAPNYAARTKEAVIDFADQYTVGENVFTQEFLSSIYGNVTGVSYVTIKAFATTSPSTKPSAYTLDNIEVGPRQKAVFSVDRIEVNLIGN